MHKILAFTILGMALTGAILIISVSLLFNTPIGIGWTIVVAGAATAFVIFASSALVLRRRLFEQDKRIS
ncbi:hypothetical protein M3197_07725 [Sporosarcina aquimarina]|uniref:hypothetical protein n=1 Tax=Sporosarcina aquimarina TaxID=114975 RepID=UPI00204058D9|nr:hypothetical protein [Sporosarcina aquimarina]MCM3757376.1 hypothetical protein [Sporosarcina aquimarina]